VGPRRFSHSSFVSLASLIRMLTELRISHFALIDRLHLELAAGFQVLTGETGAGKSILIDAIAILVGGRATADHVRSEAEESILEATFSLPPSHPVLGELRAQGLQTDGETDVIVRRILSRTGRHRIYLNDSAIPLHTLQRLAGTLVDIHGQHDQQSLLSPKMQLEALDAFGDLTELCGRVATLYESWRLRQAEAEAAAVTRGAVRCISWLALHPRCARGNGRRNLGCSAPWVHREVAWPAVASRTPSRQWCPPLVRSER